MNQSPEKMRRAESQVDDEISIERKRRGLLLVALCASAIPVLYLTCYVYAFSSALPVNDQWNVADFIVSVKEGHPNLSLLFSFHNEHLIAIPRLLFLGLAMLFTWDNRAECWLTFVFVALIFSLLWRVALKGRPRDEMAGLAALALPAFFLFSTTQWQNWLWGFQLAWPIPVLALTATIPSLYWNRRSILTGVVIATATVIAILSMGSGFMVPLILFVILSLRFLRRRDPRILSWLLLSGCLSVLSIGFSLANKPQVAGTIHFGISFFRGIALLLANPFLDYTRSLPESLSLCLGAASSISFLLIAFFICLSVCGHKTTAFETPLFSTGFALAAWALLSVSTIALARANLGFEGLAQSRYISYAVLLPVGMLLMAIDLLRRIELRDRWQRVCRIWILFAVGLAALSLRGEASRLQWGRDMRGTYLALSEFVKVAPVFPVDTELRKICLLDNRQTVFDAVARNRLIRGMVPPGKHVPASMIQMHEPIGNIDAIVPSEPGSDLTGWCGFFDTRGIPDAVFLGAPNADGSVELLAPILERHGIRSDVSAKGGPMQSGWHLHLPPGNAEQTVTLLAYDWSSNRFYRSAAEWKL